MVTQFGESDVRAHKIEITQILTHLYGLRLQECSATEQSAALTAERELHAFSLAHTKDLLSFVESRGTESPLNQARAIAQTLELYEKHLKSHALSDRTVNLADLRLQTQIERIPSSYYAFLADEPAFQEPFELSESVSAFDSIMPTRRAKKSRHKTQTLSTP